MLKERGRMVLGLSKERESRLGRCDCQDRRRRAR